MFFLAQVLLPTKIVTKCLFLFPKNMFEAEWLSRDGKGPALFRPFGMLG